MKQKDASFITLRNQNRTLYTNFRIQQQRVEKGCQLRVQLENGGTADFSIIPKLLQGAQETTITELLQFLASNACPTRSLDPYLSDNIYLSLTTNQAAYKAADIGSWVRITSAEYAALQTNVTGTALAGTDASTFSSITTGGFTFFNFAATNTNTTFTPKIDANTYLYAFAIKIKSAVTTTLDNIRVYTNKSTAVKNGFNMVGTSPIPIPVGGANYYVIKGQSAVNGPTDGLLAVTAPGDGTVNAQAMHLAFGTNLDASINFFYINNGTLPLTSSDTLSSGAGSKWGMGIQALTTPTKQWV